MESNYRFDQLVNKHVHDAIIKHLYRNYSDTRYSGFDLIAVAFDRLSVKNVALTTFNGLTVTVNCLETMR